MAKAKVAKAKVDEEALAGSRTRTRMRTSPERTPILRQGGTLSPLVDDQTRDLRPVPRRKPNKNKGLSVPTKIGTSLTPANAPVSLRMARKLQKKGPAPRSADRDTPGDLQIWCSGYVSVLGDVNTWGYWILGPLYLLWLRKFCPQGN